METKETFAVEVVVDAGPAVDAIHTIELAVDALGRRLGDVGTQLADLPTAVVVAGSSKVYPQGPQFSGMNPPAPITAQESSSAAVLRLAFSREQKRLEELERLFLARSFKSLAVPPEIHEARTEGLVAHAVDNRPDNLQGASVHALLKTLFSLGKKSTLPITMFETVMDGLSEMIAANHPEAKFLKKITRLRQYENTAFEIEALKQEASHIDANNTLTDDEKTRRTSIRKPIIQQLEDQNRALNRAINSDLLDFGKRASQLATDFQANLDRGAPGKTGLEHEAARLMVLGPEYRKVAALDPDSPFAGDYLKILRDEMVSMGVGIARQIEGEGMPPSVRKFQTPVQDFEDEMKDLATPVVKQRMEEGEAVLNAHASEVNAGPAGSNLQSLFNPSNALVDFAKEWKKESGSLATATSTVTSAMREGTEAAEQHRVVAKGIIPVQKALGEQYQTTETATTQAAKATETLGGELEAAAKAAAPFATQAELAAWGVGTLAEATESGSSSVENMFKSVEGGSGSLEKLGDSALDSSDAVNGLAESQGPLAEAFDASGVAAEGLGESVATATEKLGEQESVLEQPFLNAIDGIQDAFVVAFEELFDGGVKSFEDLGSTILDIMRSTAAQIAALLVFQPVVGGVLGGVGLGGVAGQLGFPTNGFGGLFGSGSSIAGFSGLYGSAGSGAFFTNPYVSSGIGGPTAGLAGGPTTFVAPGAGAVIGGGLAGAGIGYTLGSSTGLNTTGSTIGGALGGAVGMIWGPGGSLVGSLIGSVAGGLLGKLIAGGGKNDQRLQLATLPEGTPSSLLTENGKEFFQGGFTREGPFGTIGLVNAETGSTSGQFDAAVLDLILGVDEAIASVLSIRQTNLVAQILQEAETSSLQRGSSIGEGNIGKILKERFLTIMEGLIGRELGGAREILDRISVKDVEKIASEGQRLIKIIALFADGFERGLRALTGGLNPLEQQIFNLEEVAKNNARGLLDIIEDIREAVDILAPVIPDQADFQTKHTEFVTTTTGQGDNTITTTERIVTYTDDIEAFEKAMEEAADAIAEFNEQQEFAERKLKDMALAALGLGKASDIKPLKGVALQLESIRISFEALQPVLEEVGFTAEQAAAKIEKGLEKAFKRLGRQFEKSIQQQILEIEDPEAAALAELKKVHRQRIRDAKDLDLDLKNVRELNKLEILELEKRFAEQGVNIIKNKLESLNDFIFSLKTGPLTTLSQGDQLGAARKNFNQVAKEALAGDLDVNSFASAARSFLEEARANFGSGAGFQDAFNRVLNIAETLGIDLNDQLSADEQTAESIREEGERNRQNQDENTDRLFFQQADVIERQDKTNELLEEMITQMQLNGQENAA